MYRNTYSEVNLNNIKFNVENIIKKYSDYKYYIGVVKADCYGHNTNKVIKSIVDGGVNYLAVSSLDEALKIRKKFTLPILCLGIIDFQYVKKAINNNIDITVPSLEYFNEIKNTSARIHIKLDTGMNRLGIKQKEELDKIYINIKNSNLKFIGIYTHIYNAGNKIDTLNQVERFKFLTQDINLNEVPIVHIAQSETLSNYSKFSFCNGCRLGLIMYGFSNEKFLKSTINLCSEIILIKHIKIGESVSYGAKFKALKDTIIGVVSIGYADGVNRHLMGAYIYINDKKYKIIGKICMDMLMVEIDNTVKVHDKVYIYKDVDHINYLSKYLDTISYELICGISKRVPRKYKKIIN